LIYIIVSLNLLIPFIYQLLRTRDKVELRIAVGFQTMLILSSWTLYKIQFLLIREMGTSDYCKHSISH